MSATPEEIDLSHITPEQFAALVAGADDELIVRTVRETGTRPVLDRVFQGMQERFLPDKAGKADARIQWVVIDEGEEHRYAVTVKDAACEVAPGSIEDPTVTFTTDLLHFLKLTGGQASGPALYMTGKLKVGGHPMVAAGVQAYFEVPKPA
jgi:putative sterol carrier protein